jgi:methylmalonyl-CoA/ethylmalonyl-CoA epimerase
MRKLLDATLVETTILEERGLKLTFLEIAGTNVELLEPLEGEGPVTKFLETKGEGLHHIAFEVSDIEKTLSKLRQAEVKLLEPAPSKGAHGSLVAFIHPSSMCGVLVELCEKKGQS